MKEYELYSKNFSATGNFGFGLLSLLVSSSMILHSGVGIEEHIDLGIKYDPTIGIYGMDFYAVMGRAGTLLGQIGNTVDHFVSNTCVFLIDFTPFKSVPRQVSVLAAAASRLPALAHPTESRRQIRRSGSSKRCVSILNYGFDMC